MRPGMNDPDAIAQKLRDLPTDAAPPYDWAEFERRWQTSPLNRGWRRAGLAAAFVVLMAFAAVWVRFSTDQRDAALVSQPGENTEVYAEPNLVNAQDSAQWLANLPDEPAIVRVDTRFAVADLEDRIAWLDDALTTAQLDSEQAVHVNALRRKRAQLIDSLAQVRYAETLAAELP
jgi:hypothetical protein